MSKKFIGVRTEHDPEGRVTPLFITWEGKKYSVDRVLDVRMAAALKVGGQGMRYKCRIHGKEVYFFVIPGNGFIES